MELTLAGTHLRAVSIGGLETCIELPSWKLCFDIGRCPPSAVGMRRVLFSHAHVDHMGGVVHHAAIRHLRSMPIPSYYMPASIVPAFQAMLQAWRTLSGSSLPCEVVPTEVGVALPLGGGRWLRPFPAVHRQPTHGYALIHRHRSLLPALRELSGPEIAARRAAGLPIDQAQEVVEVVFCGDTSAEVLDQPDVRAARLLILEATFLDGSVSPEKARRLGHIHLDDLVANAHLLSQPAILLTHISPRHSPKAIRSLLDAALPSELRQRVHTLCS